MTWLSSSVSVSPAATPQIPPVTQGHIYVCVGSGANTFGNLVYICTEPNVH